MFLPVVCALKNKVVHICALNDEIGEHLVQSYDTTYILHCHAGLLGQGWVYSSCFIAAKQCTQRWDAGKQGLNIIGGEGLVWV